MDPHTKDILELLHSTDYIAKRQRSHIRRRLDAISSMESHCDDGRAIGELYRAFNSRIFVSKEVRQKTLKYFEKYDMAKLDKLCNKTIAKEAKLRRDSFELHSDVPKSPTKYLKKGANVTLEHLCKSPPTEDIPKILQSTDYITGRQKRHIRRRLDAVYSLESQWDDRKAIGELIRAFNSRIPVSKEVRQKTLKYFEKYDMVALGELIDETFVKEAQLHWDSLKLYSHLPKSPTKYLKKNVNDTLSQPEISSSVPKLDGQE